MDLPLLISIVFTIIALSAVLAGSVLARKQASAAKSQVIVHFSAILAEAGQPGFGEKIDYVRHEFHTEFAPEVPIGELPRTARAAVSPNIEGERHRRQRLATRPVSTGYLVYFEHLVWLVRSKPPAEIHRERKLRRLADLTPSTSVSASDHPLGVVQPSENA